MSPHLLYDVDDSCSSNDYVAASISNIGDANNASSREGLIEMSPRSLVQCSGLLLLLLEQHWLPIMMEFIKFDDVFY